MTQVFDWSVREFLDRAGAASPTPGGGSVAALSGALAIAMVQMVANLTLGREKYREVEPVVRAILDESGGLRAELEALAADDIAAFDQVMGAYSLPRNTAAENERRKQAIQAALRQATEVPLEVARTGMVTLRLTEQLSQAGNELVLSDAGVAGYLAQASVKSALVNVEVNARLIQDRHYVDRVLREKQRLETQATKMMNRIERTMGRRLGVSCEEGEGSR